MKKVILTAVLSVAGAMFLFMVFKVYQVSYVQSSRASVGDKILSNTEEILKLLKK